MYLLLYYCVKYFKLLFIIIKYHNNLLALLLIDIIKDVNLIIFLII